MREPIPVLACAFALTCCSPPPAPAEPEAQGKEHTNHIQLSPAVIQNLGITFETATRGKLGTWRRVPGELVVPESRRWSLRAPAAGRLTATTARWQQVAAGDEIARLTSPALAQAQTRVVVAERDLAQATREAEAARQRLAEAERFVTDVRAYEGAARQRVDDLQAINASGEALSTRELVEARHTLTEATKASLEAAIARDDLTARVATKETEAAQARLAVGEGLQELAVLTGHTVAELADGHWRDLDQMVVRAPAVGVVVELFASAGETVAADTEIARVFDPSELLFRGHLPEGDLGELAAGQPVRVEVTARDLPVITTELAAPIPVAHATSRLIRVQAVVPNETGRLVHGLSAVAQVQIRESPQEEVLIPTRCVARDGLESVVFRRDAEHQDEVERIAVELGASAAGMVEVLSGVLAGDSLVADGIHPLLRSGRGKLPEGVHVHADGSVHEDH